MGLEKYFQLEGLTYRLVPYIAQSPDRQPGVVHTEKMYQRLTKEFVWEDITTLTLTLTKQILEWY